METEVHKCDIDNPYEEISLREFVLNLVELGRYLLSKWRTFLLVGLIGGGLGLLYAFLKKPVYTAESTFVLEEQGTGTGALGQYAGLASMVGIDLGGVGSGLFQGDNIIELYKSRKMIKKALLSKYSVDGKKNLLINRYIEVNKLKERWERDPSLRGISFNIPERQFILKHDSIINVIVNDINKSYLTVYKPDKKLNIISVKVKSKDELFAKAFTDLIVQNVNRFYIDTKTKKSMDNLRILEQEADSVRHLLNSAIGGSAIASDANPNANPALQILRVPSQRRQVDVQSGSVIYAEVVKNLEIAKISLRRETPLIQLIDEPVLPLKREVPSKFGCTVIGAMFLMAFVSVYYWLRKITFKL